MDILLSPLVYLLEKYDYFALAIILLIPWCVGFCYWGFITLDVKALKLINDIDNDPLDKTNAIRSRFLRAFEKIITVIIKIIKFWINCFIVIGAGFIVFLMLSSTSTF